MHSWGAGGGFSRVDAAVTFSREGASKRMFGRIRALDRCLPPCRHRYDDPDRADSWQKKREDAAIPAQVLLGKTAFKAPSLPYSVRCAKFKDRPSDWSYKGLTRIRPGWGLRNT